ncbi:MAG TPA: tRNA (guanosine(37)-N1)-methyltransferase TrmD [Chthoniobacterales bacterium]
MPPTKPHYDILTLFPGICQGPLTESMMKRGVEGGFFSWQAHQLRDWATGKHRLTDDAPYGGGHGMVMKPEPIFAAVEQLRRPGSRIVLLGPGGRRFTQAVAREYASLEHVIFVCGHYEGIDQRVHDHLIDDELSIGDYVLTNGALAAVVVIDAVARLIPGVLGNEDSPENDSFEDGLLEFPQYTRPGDFRGWTVPEILLSGHHAAIAAWRKERSLEKTRKNRPDLLEE